MVVGGAAALLATSGTANAAGGANALSSTTNVNSTVGGGTGLCLAPPKAVTDVPVDPVNCNSYTDKADVWLSGLKPGGLDPGTYTFYVSVPGQQDNASLTLSTGSTDDRTFTVAADGSISYGGNQPYDAVNGKIDVAPFNDTTNHGGVYILTICLDGGNCKHDAFKVKNGTPIVQPGAPSAVKTALPTHVRSVHWNITKLVDGQKSETISKATAATPTYTVEVKKTVDYDTYGLTGAITVTNDNDFPLSVTVAETGLAPTVDGSACTLDSSGTLLVPATVSGVFGTASVGYTCTFTTAPDAAAWYTNTATVGYDIGQGNQVLDVASDLFQFPVATEQGAPESVTVTDAFNGGAGVLLTDATTGPTGVISDSHTFTYTRSIFNPNCVTYPNLATIVQTSQSDPASVTFCGPNTGGLTMGYWQNKNGQAQIGANYSALCTYLAAYPNVLTLPNPCTKASLLAYVSAVIKAAVAAGDGAPMFKGQFLATALSAYFTSSLATTGIVVDPSIFGSSCKTVSALLTFGNSNYGTLSLNKTTFMAVKSVYDSINNNQAVTCI